MYRTKGLANSRIEVADALRGVAVMGIVIFHSLENFNLFFDGKDMLLPSDSTIYNICEMLFSGKMYGIFALLFGVSFFIMRDNQEQKGRDFSLRFAWRMLLLFVVGLVNMAFYNGDILTSYAIFGLLIIPVAYLPNGWLWTITVMLLIQPIEIYFYATDTHFGIQWFGEAFEHTSEANMHGSFIESCATNLREGFACNWGWFLWSGRFTQTIAFFWLGILVGRLRLLYNEGNNLRIWRWVLAISLPLAIAGSNIDFGAFNIWTAPVTNMFILFAEVAAIVLLWYAFAGFRKVLSNVCFFGRMSLSNYLMQSIFGATLFYGWGFGLYAHLGATWSLITGLAIISFQILLLRFWNKNHERGPMESLWRKLTWLKF